MTLVEQLKSEDVAETDNYLAKVEVWRSDTGHLKTVVKYYKKRTMPWPFSDKWDFISRYSKMKSSYSFNEAAEDARRKIDNYQQEYDEIVE